MKIIQYCTASSSFSVTDYKKDIFIAWYAQIAFQMKKLYPQLNIEGWTIEKKFKNKAETSMNNVLIKVFPTNISIRHSMEISLKMLRELLKEQKKAKENNEKLIVHLQEHHTLQSYLTLLLLNKKTTKITSQHHGARSPFQNLKKYKKLYLFLPLILLMQFLENILLKKIDVIYAASQDEFNYLKKTSPKSNIQFQTLGIGEEFFNWNPNKNLSRKKLNLEDNKTYALFIGRITAKKGIKELLSAMKELQNKNEKIHLLLMGGGPELTIYQSLTKNLNLKNTTFLGSIYDERKFHYLSASDFLILPSYTESVPIVIMEAIAMNLPVLATKVGGIPKIIENNREGILIKPKSTPEIINGINKISGLKNKNIRKYADRFKWEKLIKNIVKDYDIDNKQNNEEY